LRIGIDYTAAAHQRAGIGRYTRGLVAALAELGTDDEFVLLITGGGTQRAEREGQQLKTTVPDHFEIRRVPLSNRVWSIIWHRLRVPLPVDLFTGRVDVFHSPD
jgi:hypothetical protein